jgi:hypothetical protein
MVANHTGYGVLALLCSGFGMKAVNSMGTYTVATEFVPLFEHKPKQFVPLHIKRVYYEDKETKAQESTGSSVLETQGGITQENQQTATPEA